MSGPESVAMLVTVAVAGSTVFMLARAVARRIEGKVHAPLALPAESSLRMERMERTLESVAIEIERISENQRFLTKVLSDRDRGRLSGGQGGAIA